MELKSAKYYKYCEDVLSGKITACENIKLACLRFKNDFQRKDIYFDEQRVERCFLFISSLRHFKGEASKSAFKLEPWEAFIVANIVGWFYVDGGNRRYTSSYIEVARKNGKTALAAALCLYFLCADGEDGAEVLMAANSKEQAKIAFEFCSVFARGLDGGKGKYFEAYRDTINFKANNSHLKVLAADDTKLDGYNASFGLIDEYHAAATNRVLSVISSSMGQRKNPHLCVITTAGLDKSKPCYQMRETAIEILHGLKDDDRQFICIFSLDEGDDPNDPRTWRKANPNLGITARADYLQAQLTKAANNPSEEQEVFTKHFNIWSNTIQTWLKDDYIIRATANIDDAYFANQPIYYGVDLAATNDLTAVAKMFVSEAGIYHFKVDYYCPASALVDGVNKATYKQWANEGYLHVTEGNVTDYDYITRDIMAFKKKAQIMAVSFDKWNSTQWQITAECEAGLPLEPFAQNLGNFNAPTKELERLILSGKVRIDNNPITRFCFRNVVLKSDWNGNVKPVKDLSTKVTSSQKKIDGVIAMIQALGVYLQKPHYSNTI